MPEECLSVLHTAAISWQAASVNYLLSSTNDGPMMEVDAPTNKSNTPLTLAFQGFTVYWHPCQEQFRDTVIALLRNGTQSVHLHSCWKSASVNPHIQMCMDWGFQTYWQTIPEYMCAFEEI